MTKKVQADPPQVGDRVKMTMRSKATREGIVQRVDATHALMKSDGNYLFRRPLKDVEVLIRVADLTK